MIRDGHESVRAWAPGRVNLIGEHTDYNGGFALPFALDLGCEVTMVPRADGLVVVMSHNVDGPAGEVRLTLDDLEAGGVGQLEPAWVRYVAATLVVRGGVPEGGVGIAVESTVPLGAGLSSSAALEVAVATALDALAGRDAAHAVEVAASCQRAELLASGVPCGIMDQLASAGCTAGHAMLLDCRSLEIEQVPMPDELEWVVIHSGVSRELADGAYAQRRAMCEAAAARLGLDSLRDAHEEQVADDPIARHVVRENIRVLDMVDALRARDFERVGGLLLEGHASLRDDFQVSTPEVDALVEELTAAGALGARMTGGGFGGCVIAVTGAGDGAGVAARAAQHYRERTGLDTQVFAAVPAGGAALR
ncbi:MAG: galactokinase [Thermoleophilia bacterium]|nr:galactokinase [Thermoleophilia bacterium]